MSRRPGVDPRIGTKLRQLRQERGLSLRELAQEAHYSHTHLWELEAGRKAPTLQLARWLDDFFGADAHFEALVPVKSRPASGRSHRAAVGEPGADALAAGAALDAVDAVRPQLEGLARRYRAAGDGAELYDRAVHVAEWIHRAFVTQDEPLLRLGSSRYQRAGSGLSPFEAEARQQRKAARAVCRSVERCTCPADVSVRLRFRGRQAHVVRRENWYYVDGEPAQIGVSFLPAALVEGTAVAAERKLGPGGIYARLAEAGLVVAHTREEVFARLATAEESDALNLPFGVPVLVVTHTSQDRRGEPFLVTQFVLRSDRNRVLYELSINS